MRQQASGNQMRQRPVGWLRRHWRRHSSASTSSDELSAGDGTRNASTSSNSELSGAGAASASGDGTRVQAPTAIGCASAGSDGTRTQATAASGAGGGSDAQRPRCRRSAKSVHGVGHRNPLRAVGLTMSVVFSSHLPIGRMCVVGLAVGWRWGYGTRAVRWCLHAVLRAASVTTSTFFVKLRRRATSEP